MFIVAYVVYEMLFFLELTTFKEQIVLFKKILHYWRYLFITMPLSGE